VNGQYEQYEHLVTISHLKLSQNHLNWGGHVRAFGFWMLWLGFLDLTEVDPLTASGGDLVIHLPSCFTRFTATVRPPANVWKEELCFHFLTFSDYMKCLVNPG